MNKSTATTDIIEVIPALTADNATERQQQFGQCPVEQMYVGDVWRLAKAMGVTTGSVVEASLSITNGSTTVEVIPVLTADNFNEVIERYRERAAGSAFCGEGGNRLRNPAIITADGKDTVWIVADTEDRLWLDSALPCSVTNCRGHDANDAGTWGALSHEVLEVNLPTRDLGKMDVNDGYLSLRLCSGRQVINLYSHIEGEIRVDQLDDFIAQLKATVAAVEAFKEQV